MNQAVRKGRAVLVELYTRIIKSVKDKDTEVYWNGENNHYPSEIERVVNSSPTAKRAAKIMAKFIAGKGLRNEAQDIIVNEKKNYRLSNIAHLAAEDAAEQGGAWIHVGYGFDIDGESVRIKPNKLDVLDYAKCRKSKEDDELQDSKVRYKDYAEVKSAFGKATESEKWFYPFNSNQDVVIAQIKADYKEKKGEETDDITVMLPYYRGQVYYWNTTPKYKYALAPIDPVYNDADTEARIQTYTNKEVRTGFLGKTALITAGLDVETAEKVDKDIKSWLGDENAGGIYRLDVERAEDVTKIMHVIQLKAQIDPKLFSDMKKELQTSIMGAFNSIPEILVLSASGALFGASGEAYEQAKIFYNEQTSDLRWKLSEMLTFIGFPCEILPIVDTDKPIESDKTADAQAQLKGSVGGVTALIELQKSVSQGYTQRKSAIEIVKTIYGIDEQTAEIMIGDPVETAPETAEIPA